MTFEGFSSNSSKSPVVIENAVGYNFYAIIEKMQNVTFSKFHSTFASILVFMSS